MPLSHGTGSTVAAGQKKPSGLRAKHRAGCQETFNEWLERAGVYQGPAHWGDRCSVRSSVLPMRPEREPAVSIKLHLEAQSCSTILDAATAATAAEDLLTLKIS